MKDSWTMAIVLPHGVLFRGAAEGTIRVMLKKHREGRDVLSIDASKLFAKEKKQNVMQEEHISRVLELYNNRKPVEKEAYLASYEAYEMILYLVV